MRCQVPRSTPAARTCTRTSFAAIAGAAIRSSLSTSLGPAPYRRCTIACIIIWPGAAAAGWLGCVVFIAFSFTSPVKRPVVPDRVDDIEDCLGSSTGILLLGDQCFVGGPGDHPVHAIGRQRCRLVLCRHPRSIVPDARDQDEQGL